MAYLDSDLFVTSIRCCQLVLCQTVIAFQTRYIVTMRDGGARTSRRRIFNGSDLHSRILSYILDPRIMTRICSVSNCWHSCCFDQAAWLGTIIDTPKCYKPVGCCAWNHFRCWDLAKFVVVRPWMFRCFDMCMDSSLQPWEWLIQWKKIESNPSVILSRIGYGRSNTAWRQFRGTWLRLGSAALLRDVHLLMNVNKGCGPNLSFGITNTSDIGMVTTMVVNEYVGHRFQEERHRLAEADKFKHYYCVLRLGYVSFYLNSHMLYRVPCPEIHGRVVITFRITDAKLVFGIDDLMIQTPLPPTTNSLDELQFPLLVLNDVAGPQDMVLYAEPLLSMQKPI
jgi:hypothetical protein